MLTIAFVLSALQLLASVAASPVDRSSEGTRISLNRRRDFVTDGMADIEALLLELSMVRSKYKNTIAAYVRNTGLEPPISQGEPIDLPTNVTTPSKRATAAVALTDNNNVMWYGQISVGTPASTYTVDFDTGSSDLFLPGPQCTSNCQGHHSYDPAASSTSRNRQRTFSLRYGDGSAVQGQQYTDTVAAGALTATNQALGAASSYSSGFAVRRFPSDGLLGMGFQSISQYNSPPFFQTLITQTQTTQPVFGFKLAQSGSELFLGGVDSALYSGSFTYAPVTRQAYWQIQMDAVAVGSRVTSSGLSTIIDTGTTLIIGDATNVKKLFSQIPGSKDASRTVGPGFYTIPCNNIPTVKLTFGGTAFSIDPAAFNFGRVSPNSRDCIAGVVSSGTSQSFWIVGDVFLRGVYTAFDVGQARVGFAALA